MSGTAGHSCTDGGGLLTVVLKSLQYGVLVEGASDQAHHGA
jgi:hypothetical protein